MFRCLGCMNEYDDRSMPAIQRVVCPYCGYDQTTPPVESYQLRLGTILEGKYIVGKVLGAGGFGVTYIGFDASLERIVAIKEYLPGNFATRAEGQSILSVFPGEPAEQFAAGLKSFIEEAKLLATVADISGIVSVYDSFTDNNTGYIVMEYLRGRTVKDALKADGVFTYDQALTILTPVLDALDKVHGAGLVHRDIAPDNIFLCDDGSVRLIDFGASRYATTIHSKSLSVILKPGYAPEEQYRSKGVQGPFTDVYAVSATLYKMITGVTPEDAMDRSLEDTLKEPSKLGATLPQYAENAIMNALNVHATDRYQTAPDFSAALHSEDTSRDKVIIKRPDAGRMPMALRIAIGFIAAIIGGLGIAVGTGIIDLSGGGILSDPSLAFADGYMNTTDVQNMTSTDAKSYIEKLGLYYLIVGKEDSEDIPEGRIMSQDPPPGSRIYQGEPVSVVISGGKAEKIVLLTMPDVVYKSQEEAESLLNEAEIPYIIDYAESDDVATGHVISQSIEAGSKVEGTDQATIVISLGSEKQEEAINNIGSTDRPEDPLAGNSGGNKGGNEDDSKGKPEDNDNDNDNSENKPVEKVTVPNVIGQSESSAISSLSSAGLNYRVTRQKMVNASDGVVSQSISGGSSVTKGTSVNLVVCVGTPSWSKWTLKANMPSSVTAADYQIETKTEQSTEYRFRGKESKVETTTNTTGVTPEGYTQINKEQTGWTPGAWGDTQKSNSKPSFSTTGGHETGRITSEGYEGSGFSEWSGWTEGNAPANVTKNGVVTKEYEQKEEGVFKTQYQYSRWVVKYNSGGYMARYGNFDRPGSTIVRHEATPWFDNPLNKVSWDSQDSKQVYGSYNNGNGTWGSRLANAWYNEVTQQVKTGSKNLYRSRTQEAIKYYEYQTREIKPVYTYTYTKTVYFWGSWSDWSTNAVTATENRQVETRAGASAEYVRFRKLIEPVW